MNIKLTCIAIVGAVTLLLAGCSNNNLTVNKDNRLPSISNDKLGHIQIFDEQVLDIIDPNAKLEIVSSGYKWTEGPVWVEEGSYLLFSDIPNETVMQYTPSNGTNIYLNNSGFSNGLLVNHNNQLVLMQSRPRQVGLMNANMQTPSPVYLSLINNYQGKRLNSPNDGVFHNNGSLYFTDPPYGLPGKLDDPNKELSFQGVYRLSTSGKLQLLDDSIKFPNGITLSNDQKTLYVAASDPDEAAWWAYDVKDDGSLTNKRLFYDATYALNDNGHGLPDGMKVHSSGLIFATGPLGVFVFNSDGKLMAHINVDRAVANCAFDEDEKTLYLTATDQVIALKLN